MKKNKNYIQWGVTAFLVILASIVSFYIVNNTRNFSSNIQKIFVILTPVVDGMIMGYLLTPLLNFIEKKILNPVFDKLKLSGKKKMKRSISVILTMFIVIIAVYGFFAMAIPQVIVSIETIINQFPSYVDNLESWLSKLLEDNPEIEQYVTTAVNQYSVTLEEMFNKKVLPQVQSLLMVVSMSVISVLKTLWNLIIGFIISIYILGSKEVFAAQAKKIVYAFCPVDTANRYINNIRFTNKIFGGFFAGKILDSIIIGIICFIVTSIMRTPYSVLVSVIIGVTNIIPFFGPFLGAIPSLLLILLVSPIQALYFLIFVIILQQIDGNIIGPMILGDSTGLSGFWVIFSITLFGGMLGVPGMIIGVPIFAVIFAFIKSLIETKLLGKNLPKETYRYLRLLYIEDDNSIVEFEERETAPFECVNRVIVKNEIRQEKVEDNVAKNIDAPVDDNKNK